MRITPVARHAILLLAAATALYPIVYMAITAFKSQDEYARDRIGIPTDPTFDNVSVVLHDPNLVTWLMNSVVITGGAVLLSTVVGVLAAYPMARSLRWWPGGVLPLLIVLLAIPPVVVVVPLYIMMANLELLSTRLGAIVTYAGFLTPLAIFLLMNFVRGIPRELDDAAEIDGARRSQVLWFILLPLMRPALVTIAVVGAVYVWNEFLIALLFLQSEESKTIMVGIAALNGRFGINEPVLMAWSVMASLPVILLFIFGQRFFVRGLTAGAVKS